MSHITPVELCPKCGLVGAKRIIPVNIPLYSNRAEGETYKAWLKTRKRIGTVIEWVICEDCNAVIRSKETYNMSGGPVTITG